MRESSRLPCIFWFACGAVSLSADLASQQVTRESLCAAVTERHAAVQSLRAVYRRPRPHDFLRNPYVRAELVVVGKDRFLLDFSHGSDTQNWELDYSRHRSFIWNDEYLVEWPGLLAYETRKLGKDEELERFTVQSWFRATGWWPVGSVRPAPKYRGSPLSLVAALANAKYRLVEKPEELDGVKCWVVENPGVDRIWLDPARGWTVLRRQFSDRKLGGLVLDVRIREVREVAAGIWMPTRYSQRYYEKGPRGPGMDVETTVDSIEVNSVAPAAVEFVRKPGLFLMDRARREHWKQEIPGGTDHIVAHGDTLHRQFKESLRRPLSWLWGLAFGAFWIALEVLRRRQKSRLSMIRGVGDG